MMTLLLISSAHRCVFTVHCTAFQQPTTAQLHISDLSLRPRCSPFSNPQDLASSTSSMSTDRLQGDGSACIYVHLQITFKGDA